MEDHWTMSGQMLHPLKRRTALVAVQLVGYAVGTADTVQTRAGEPTVECSKRLMELVQPARYRNIFLELALLLLIASP